ncbi:sensor histidine kinase [Bacillus sp. FJAT-27986]|uniref:sensor histidine kinase n=1 Tax=Bacillus sp. FJAT-27986 TaxID=1743146 RepID=UPI00080ACE06|nr:ATP-binding protein [Bacillus sp. FJAT-27986]OCA83465.1 hypothetical protein A8L44_11555 [Bacillus sp. FJAT-27986]
MKNIKKSMSIKRKILTLLVLLMLITIILISIIGYKLMNAYTEDILYERGKGMVMFGSSMIPSRLINEASVNTDSSIGARSKLKTYLNEMDKQSNHLFSGHIILYNENKKHYEIISASDGTQPNGIKEGSPFIPSKRTLPYIQKVIHGENPQITEIYKESSNKWVNAYAGIDGLEGSNKAILAVTINADEVFTKNLYWLLLFIGSILIIFCMAYGVLCHYLNKLMGPVHKLIIGITKVSQGEFNIKLTEDSSTEFEELFEQFNYMVHQLHILFEKLSITSVQIGSKSNNEMLINNFDEAIKEIDNIVYRTSIQKELQQAEKMNAIGQLAASVAHEIRNPMTVVKGFLQIFQNKSKLSEEELSYIKLMVDEINRAEGIINDYLSLAKPDLGSKEYVMLSEFSAHIVDLMNGYALMVSNIHLHFELDFDLEIYINTNEVKQVLINIMKNGIEAMKDGGELTLSIQKEGECIVFSVSDTGNGMSEEQIKRLGTAFYSLKDKGTGIGLMVCYQVIERMKGKIEVESEKNKGTTFKVYVPFS